MDKIKEWAKKNRFLAIVIGIFAIIPALIIIVIVWGLASFAWNTFSSYNIAGGGDMFYSPLPMHSSPMISDSIGVNKSFDRSLEYEESMDYYPGDDYGTSSSQIEIREGSMSVKSKSAESDFAKLREAVEGYDGYIENSSKNEWATTLQIDAQVRIPVTSFDDLISFLEEGFDIRSFTVTDYRVETQQQLDELAIIKQALEDYDVMRKKLQGATVDSEKIRVLSEITREMQQLAREQKRIEGNLDGLQEKSDMAMVSVTFRETVSPKIWPDDVVVRFRDHLSWAIETVIKTITNLFANGIVVFVKVIEYIFYVILIVVPVRFTWRWIIGKRKEARK